MSSPRPRFRSPAATAGASRASPTLPTNPATCISSWIASSRCRRAKGALHGKIDPKHIGVAGHSLGAITTLGYAERSCCRDPRVDAAISISGTPLIAGTDFGGDGLPLLLIHGDHDPTVPYAGSSSSYVRAQPPKYFLTVLGGLHSNFLGSTPAAPRRGAYDARLLERLPEARRPRARATSDRHRRRRHDHAGGSLGPVRIACGAAFLNQRGCVGRGGGSVRSLREQPRARPGRRRRRARARAWRPPTSAPRGAGGGRGQVARLRARRGHAHPRVGGRRPRARRRRASRPTTSTRSSGARAGRRSPRARASRSSPPRSACAPTSGGALLAGSRARGHGGARSPAPTRSPRARRASRSWSCPTRCGPGSAPASRRAAARARPRSCSRADGGAARARRARHPHAARSSTATAATARSTTATSTTRACSARRSSSRSSREVAEQLAAFDVARVVAPRPRRPARRGASPSSVGAGAPRVGRRVRRARRHRRGRARCSARSARSTPPGTVAIVGTGGGRTTGVARRRRRAGAGRRRASRDALERRAARDATPRCCAPAASSSPAARRSRWACRPRARCSCAAPTRCSACSAAAASTAARSARRRRSIRTASTAAARSSSRSRSRAAGTVHTFVVNQTMPAPFVAPLPIAVLDMDDGARLMLQVVGDGTDVEIGGRVELVLRKYAHERGVPVYGFKARPVRAPGGGGVMAWNRVAVVGAGLIKMGELFEQSYEQMAAGAFDAAVASVDKGFEPQPGRGRVRRDAAGHAVGPGRHRRQHHPDRDRARRHPVHPHRERVPVGLRRVPRRRDGGRERRARRRARDRRREDARQVDRGGPARRAPRPATRSSPAARPRRCCSRRSRRATCTSSARRARCSRRSR